MFTETGIWGWGIGSGALSAKTSDAKAGTSLQQVQLAMEGVQTNASFETLPSLIMV
jgi:hypothetical protein